MYDSLKNENENLDKTLTQKQNKLMNFHNENESLLKELNKLKNDLILKTNEINILTEQKAAEENKFIYQRQLNQTQIEQKDMAIQSLLINLKQLEKEISDNNLNKEIKENNIDDKLSETNTAKDTNDTDIGNNPEIKEKEIDNKQFKYLEKKFTEEKYTDNEVINLLTTDLYDFYHYNKMIYESRIQEINKTITMLKKLLEIEAEIKLYGSYATKTSLVWSEVDLLIIPNINDLNFSESNIYGNFIQRIFHKLKSSFMNIFYIDDLQIITPVIKVEIGEPSLIYNIFVLDNSNFNEIKNVEDNSLIKSIILTNDYINKYKGKYIPLLLGMKQLLFSGHFIDNYHSRKNDINVDNINLNLNTAERERGISSYALNILLMNFLDNYNLTSDDIPLGQIFIDFLKAYGGLMHENNSKRIIYLDYDNNGQKEKLEEIKFNNENIIDKLIIIDPFNFRNNLTEKSIKISQFVIAFKIAFSVIKDSCECACHYNDDGNYQGKIHCILNKIFKTVKRFTSIKKNKKI
jgi:predicted nucleotidyltransferase